MDGGYALSKVHQQLSCCPKAKTQTLFLVILQNYKNYICIKKYLSLVNHFIADKQARKVAIIMTRSISEQLFRSLGTHAVKKICISEGRLELVVAPWSDLENEGSAIFNNMTVSYIEAERDSLDTFLDFNLPWDIIRFDSESTGLSTWRFGLCCRDIVIGFVANWPVITFSNQ